MDVLDSTFASTMDYTKGPNDVKNSNNLVIGVLLAISSSILIGSSFIIKKKGLLRVSRGGDSSSRAGSGGYGYLKDWVWWAGFITMGTGELANFIAYAFAPASLVTPLGALSVLFAAILASYLLNENLNICGKIGCFVAILGSTMIVIHAPAEAEVDSFEVLTKMLASPGFIVYVCIVVLMFGILVFILAPRYGRKNMIIYIATCSVVGSLTVMACKGVGIGIKQTIGGQSQLGNWVFWLLALSVVFCIVIQMNYLNKALDIFNTAVVSPVYYVLFTTCTIVASAILFKEWASLGAKDAVGSVCGFLTIIVGVFLLHAFKDLKLSYKHLPSAIKKDDRRLPNGEGEKMIDDWDGNLISNSNSGDGDAEF
ncbi:Magnesium transporter NIPA2 [Trichoplax sp. H2]|nr:Magnesium transporter NIPA2 [Trichoplax sp. H2]|eukprot:RDD45913.1 Magnesium transporter NIPA2 [Trichoplax sp. H2]